MRVAIIKISAIMCLVVGLLTLWLPIPTGLILIATGLGLLLMISERVARWVTGVRRRFAGLDRLLKRAEPYLPRKLRRALARTRTARGKVPAGE